jgi:hypothetical protein
MVKTHCTRRKMRACLDYRHRFLCVLIQNAIDAKKWFPVSRADHAEVQTLLYRPVTSVNQEEGIYVDEEGNVFQLLNKGKTKPIEVEQLPATEKSELEALLEASLKGKKAHKQNGDSRRMQQKHRNNGHKQEALQMDSSASKSLSPEATASAGASSGATNVVGGYGTPAQLNLRQKLAEVRRRIGYVQKRGHNERFNYSYVTAADIAGSVGDILAELGVVVIPKLEEISYESAASRGEAIRMARVVMAYTFADVDSGEEVIAKVAGQGLDSGDKAPYKAMTGALKYALLQSFLLATGDDPEDERGDARYTTPGSDRAINAEEVRELEKRIEETGTDLQRVLAYYKVSSLGEMTETAYRRAIEVLNRKLAKRSNQETVHAQD